MCGSSSTWRASRSAYRQKSGNCIRAPFNFLRRTVFALKVGACGLLMQTLFRNPLADPYALGIIHGARLAVAIVVVLAGAAGTTYATKYGLMGTVALTIAATIGAVAVMLLIRAASRRVNAVTLLIVGLMIGYTAMGLISAVLHFTDEGQARVFQK